MVVQGQAHVRGQVGDQGRVQAQAGDRGRVQAAGAGMDMGMDLDAGADGGQADKPCSGQASASRLEPSSSERS